MPRRFHSAVRLGATSLLLVGLAACGGDGGTSSGSATSSSACPIDTPAELVGTKLATVGGKQVGTVGWEAAAAREAPADGQAWSPDEKKTILQEAIDEEVLFQEAFRRGLYQDPKVRRILINLLLRAEIYEKVPNEAFSTEELQAYFDEHREEFVIPAKAQLKRLFVAINDQRPREAALALAEELRAKVVADPEKTWTKVATESSEDPFARRGGEVGYVDPGGKPGVPDLVIARAFEIEPGTVSEVFEAGGGFNVIYVSSRRERIDRNFEQMRGAVLRRMKNLKYEELTRELVAKLRAGTDIVVDEAALASWTPPVAERAAARVPLDVLRPEARTDEGQIEGVGGIGE